MSAGTGIDASLPVPAAGRSLWSDAWRRLRANRAAMAGAIFLVAMTLACFAGPLLLPHDYNTAFRDYTRVPASLAPYPQAEQVEPAARQALRRARVAVDSLTLADGTVSIAVSSTRAIDPRIGVYLDRTGLFANGRVAALAPDGLSATVAADIRQEHFFFGTDANGRDLLARTLVAGRVSLTI